MNWRVEFLPEAQKDFNGLAGNQRLLVAKALKKVQQNPVSIYDGGYGKPLGNKGGWLQGAVAPSEANCAGRLPHTSQNS